VPSENNLGGTGKPDNTDRQHIRQEQVATSSFNMTLRINCEHDSFCNEKHSIRKKKREKN